MKEKGIVIIVLFLVVIACSPLPSEDMMVIDQASESASEPPTPSPEPSAVAEETAEPARNLKNQDEVSDSSSPYDTSRVGEGNLASLPSCGDTKTIFNIFPVNLDDFPIITPVGYVGATAHLTPTPHLFLRPKRAGPAQQYTEASTVVAPADMRIYIVNSVEDVSKEKKFETDYALYFSPCKEVAGYLDHVWDLSPKVREAVATSTPDFCEEYTLIYDRPVDWKFCRTKISVDVQEGEYVGQTGGAGNADVFDFALADYRLPRHPYVDEERWRNMGNTFEEAFYYTCPLNYFPDDIRLKAESKLGAENQKRTIQPICGEVFQDKYGTAQGVWFISSPGSNQEHGSEFLSLVHDVIDPRTPQFAVGEGLPSMQYGDYFYTVKEQGKVNRDFADVMSSEIYCFEQLRDKQEQAVEGHIIVQLPTERRLLLEKQAGNCGSGPWAFSGKESRLER